MMLVLAGCATQAQLAANATVAPEAAVAEPRVWRFELPAGASWYAFHLRPDPSWDDPEWGSVMAYSIDGEESAVRMLGVAPIKDDDVRDFNIHWAPSASAMSQSPASREWLLVVATENASAPATLRFGFVDAISDAIAAPPRVADAEGSTIRLAYFGERSSGPTRSRADHGVEVQDTRTSPPLADTIAAGGQLSLAMASDVGPTGLHACSGSLGVSPGARQGELRVEASFDGTTFAEDAIWISTGGARTFSVLGEAASMSLDVTYAPNIEFAPTTTLSCLSISLDLRTLGLSAESGVFGVADVFDNLR